MSGKKSDMIIFDELHTDPYKHILKVAYDCGYQATYSKFVLKTMPSIDKVIFNKNITVVIWHDKTKTIVKRRKGDKKSKEVALAMAVAKKYFGSRSQFLKAVENGKVYK